MASTKELREKRGQLEHQMRALVDKAEKEDRGFTAEEDEQFKKLHDDDVALRGRIEKQEILEVREKEVRNHGIDRDQSPATGVDGRSLGDDDEPEQRGRPSGEHRALAFQAWCMRQNGIPLTKRHKEACQRAGIHPGRKILDLRIGVTGDVQLLQEEFRTKHPTHINRYEKRALSAGTATAGAETVPEGFMNRLEMSLLYFGPMMQVAEIVRTDGGGDLPWPTMNDTSNEGEIIGENTTIGASVDPTFGATILEAFNFSSKLIQASSQLLEDSAFNLAEVLGDICGTRIGRHANNKFTVGTGTNEPRGIVTAASVGKTAASGTAITADELIDLFHSVDIAYRTGAGWMFHDNIALAIRKLKGSDNNYLWQSGLQSGLPDRLLGAQVFPNNHMASSIAINAKTALFGQLSKYKIRQVRTIRLRRLVERYADIDAEGFVAFMRMDGDLLDAGTDPVRVLQQAAA